MNWQVVLKRSAEKELDSLESALYRRIRMRLLELESNPRPSGAKKLHGGDGYRLRIGNYRALYEIDESQRKVIVYAVRHRREAYR